MERIYYLQHLNYIISYYLQWIGYIISSKAALYEVLA